MSRIKAKDTSPEISLRKALWKNGIRYRKNNKTIIGNPDIAIKKYKLAIFIDGEFWHGYNWSDKKTRIKSNREYWIKKIERNIKRDNKNNILLKNQNWTVLRYWEHEIKKELDRCVDEIISTIYSAKIIKNKNV